MKRLLSLMALTGALGACALNLGGPRDIPVSAAALRLGPDADANAVAEALRSASVDAALVAGAVDSAWLASVAEATGLTLSGPGAAGDLSLAFLGDEPLGDTTVVLPFTGGSLVVHDALYRPGKERLLDLMIFRLDHAEQARPAITALLEYMATDVSNAAAVVIAVAVPSAAIGDTVRRMLSPAYFDALRCEPGLTPPGDRDGIRLFYGPEARVYCRSAAVEASVGEGVRAELTIGRR